ncbi:hypothetical protein D3C75_1125570 [compost metagenome]
MGTVNIPHVTVDSRLNRDPAVRCALNSLPAGQHMQPLHAGKTFSRKDQLSALRYAVNRLSPVNCTADIQLLLMIKRFALQNTEPLPVAIKYREQPVGSINRLAPSLSSLVVHPR